MLVFKITVKVNMRSERLLGIIRHQGKKTQQLYTSINIKVSFVVSFRKKKFFLFTFC